MEYEISEKIKTLSYKVIGNISDTLKEIDRTAEINTERVMNAFRKYKVSDSYFAGTTGYGYDDIGREKLDDIYADVFGSEAALVRIGFVNGTHAITTALFSILRPGDVLLSATGMPYDTLQSAIGITGNYPGSMRDYNIGFSKVDLNEDGKPRLDEIRKAAADRKVRGVLIQRSRGYSERPAISVSEIGKICDAVHSVNSTAAVIVDNCYGEFVESLEPGHVGADIVAGSLIKNPGGGLAPTGGYIAGKKSIVDAAAMRLTAPGIGGECGATLNMNRLLYQGFFMAPHTVAQALKTAVFCAGLMDCLGYRTYPGPKDPRSDIIQVVEFGKPELLTRFCKGIQSGGPIDSFVTPEPWNMPGYDCQVIMAAGSFIQGASIELSADGPMREPYRAFLQGGLTFESGKLGVMLAATMLEGQ